MMKRTSGPWAMAGAMLALGLLACGSDAPGARPEADGEDPAQTGPDGGTGLPGDDGDDASDAGDGEPPSPACGEAASDAQAVFVKACSSCHGGLGGQGGFGTVLDARALVEHGRIVANDPEASPLFQRMTKGEMPPAQVSERPSTEDLDAVRKWVECGAIDPGCPEGGCYTPTTIATRQRVMIEDLREIPVEERPDVRYIDLSQLATRNREFQARDYFQALSYLLNSVSNAPLLAVPVALDDSGMMLRIRLSSYAISPATWETIVADYPYAVAYADESAFHPDDDSDGEALREATGTNVPHVQGDWLFAHLARPPLYYEVLGIPETLAQLETKLGIDLAQNIADELVSRAGFARSSLSRFNRIIERQPLGAEGRGMWLTYDFDSSLGASNIFLNPLAFTPASSEIFFELENGMTGFVIVDGNGARLDVAPRNAVQDEYADDRGIEAGVSCLNCHVEQGLFRVTDEIQANPARVSFSNEERATIDTLYDQTVLDEWFDADSERFQAAMATAQVRGLGVGRALALESAHARDLDLIGVAATLGVDPQALLAAISSSSRDYPASITALANDDDITLPREVLDQVFAQLVTAMALGTSIVP